MRYLLDTNICIFFFRNKFNVPEILLEKGLENCFVSEITIAELRYGAEKSENPQKHHSLIDSFLQYIDIVPITESISVFAQEKAKLDKAGMPVNDDFDLLIGATAIQHKMTLVTENHSDFKNMTKIKIENWVKR